MASAIGAVAVYMMMPRRGYTPSRIGGLLGAMTLGGLWLYLAKALPATLGIADEAFVYYYIFSGIAIASSVRVITHTKPVYAALWFVMVVLASAGMFLLLGAEFMAMAMVIIYGGAILVTYLFVIMLASQDAGEASGEKGDYERLPYEPVAAVAVGFLLLATLLVASFNPAPANPAARGESDERIIATVLTDRPAKRLAEHTGAGVEGAPGLPTALADRASLYNTERIGLDLFRGHPLGLELAGVILLVSLAGAVVIARLRVDPQPDGGDGDAAGRLAADAV